MIVAPDPAPVVQVDPRALYFSAVADRQAGRPAEALGKLERILATDPHDVDARLNLGLALLALDRVDQARDAFNAVISQAPDYADAHLGLARVEQRRGDLAAARAHAAEALSLAPRDRDAADLVLALRASPVWRMDLTVASSRLSGGLPDWTETRLSAARALAGAWTAGGAVEMTRRFGDTDLYIEARTDRAFTAGSAWVAVGGAPDADYRPEIAAAVGGRMTLAPGLAGTVEVATARYRTGVVTGLHPGLEADLAGGRVQLSARWINLRDETGEHRQGWTAAGRWRATDRIALRAGVAEAPESSEGVTADVSSWHAGVDLRLSQQLSLRVGYLAEDRGTYDREDLSASLGWRF